MKHGAAAARRLDACCSDESVGVTPIRSKPTDTAATGCFHALLMPVQKRKIEIYFYFPPLGFLTVEDRQPGNMDEGEYQDGMVYNISQRKNRDYLPG